MIKNSMAISSRVLDFSILDFEIVSDFDIRVSNFKN